MSTQLVTPLGNSSPSNTALYREEPFNAPFSESTNNRTAQLGPFRSSNVAAVATNVAMTVGGVDAAAPSVLVAAKAGKIIGVTSFSGASLTDGSVRVNPVVNGRVASATGALMTASATSKVAELSSPLDFAAGDLLGVSYAVGASGATPSGANLSASLVIKWSI